MTKNASYRKNNDRTHNSSTYHKKDGTPVRHLLKQEAKEEIDEIEEWEDYETIDEARNEIKRLRNENQQLRNAVNIVLDNATGHPGGEAHCNWEAFAAFEKLVEETEDE
jgi:hypothetical protein